MPRCPKPRYLHGSWPLGCRKPRYLHGCWPSTCRKPRNLRGCPEGYPFWNRISCLLTCLPAYLPPYLPAYRPTLHKWPGLVPKAILSGTESPSMVSYSRACHCRRTPNLRTQVQEPVVSCWGFPGGPGSPQEVPGGRRRQPRKHQETPEEAPGAAGGARRVPRCPKPRYLHGLGTLRCPKPRYLRGFWPLGCRKPRNLRGCWPSGCRKPCNLRGFWPMKCPKPRY